MCDQVVSLISPEHAQTILWSEEDSGEEDILEVDQDESDRMFTFEVAQTNEQEETVAVRKGFKVSPSWFCALASRLTNSTYDIPIFGCFEGDCSSRSTYRRSGSDETCADPTVFALW